MHSKYWIHRKSHHYNLSCSGCCDVTLIQDWKITSFFRCTNVAKPQSVAFFLLKFLSELLFRNLCNVWLRCIDQNNVSIAVIIACLLSSKRCPSFLFSFCASLPNFQKDGHWKREMYIFSAFMWGKQSQCGAGVFLLYRYYTLAKLLSFPNICNASYNTNGCVMDTQSVLTLSSAVQSNLSQSR